MNGYIAIAREPSPWKRAIGTSGITMAQGAQNTTLGNAPAA